MQRVSRTSLSRTMLVAVLAVACVQLLPAQKKEKEDPTIRSLQGQVNDAQDKPVSGAVVQLKDTRTLEIRSFITRKMANTASPDCGPIPITRSRPSTAA